MKNPHRINEFLETLRRDSHNLINFDKHNELVNYDISVLKENSTPVQQTEIVGCSHRFCK